MRSACLCILAAVLPVLPLKAQAAPAPAPAPAVHRVEKLTDHSYVIFGPGGNVGLFIAGDEALLVDGQMEKDAPGLLKAVRSVTPNPIRYLVNTHVHRDHVGANRVWAREGALVVAHANVGARLAKDPGGLVAGPHGGLPDLLFGEGDPAQRARMDIHLGGAEFHLLHICAAHTDGDLVFGYPAELVMHMGDLFFHGLLPYVDTGRGGSFDGLAAEMDQLASWLPADVKIIPGHGPMATRKDLLRYRDLLRAVQAHVKAHPGLTPAALAAAFDTAAWPDYKPQPGFVTWESLFASALPVAKP